MSRRVLAIGLLLGALATPLFGRQEPTDAEEALLGFDPVILIEESREVLGQESISVTRGRFWYLFANEANKKKFETDPERYEIQLGGVCARMGGSISGDADNYMVHDGRIYIFGSKKCRELFAEDPDKYLEPNQPVVKATPQSRRKAMAALDRALQYLGGATRVDSVRAVHQKAVREEAGVSATVDVWRAFPDRWKTLVHHPRYGEFGNLINESGAYRVGAGGVRALPPGPALGLRAELLRHPLEILRSRTLPGFEASLVEEGGSRLERVRTSLGEIVSVLGIDGKSGEIREISYRGRGEEGEVGTVVKRFSDYREVSGLRLPFRIEASFEGAPLEEESLVIDSIELNPKFDTALFAATKSGGR